MDPKIWNEFFQDNRGSGGVPIAVGTDIISDPFDFLPAHEGVGKNEYFLQENSNNSIFFYQDLLRG